MVTVTELEQLWDKTVTNLVADSEPNVFTIELDDKTIMTFKVLELKDALIRKTELEYKIAVIEQEKAKLLEQVEIINTVVAITATAIETSTAVETATVIETGTSIETATAIETATVVETATGVETGTATQP